MVRVTPAVSQPDTHIYGKVSEGTMAKLHVRIHVAILKKVLENVRDLREAQRSIYAIFFDLRKAQRSIYAIFFILEKHRGVFLQILLLLFICLVRPQVNCYCCVQGRPVYLGDFGCSFYFEWESFEFCTDLAYPANEIPCFVYNNSQLIDLSPLTKLKGGYLVDSENNRDFYINVCRDLTPGEMWSIT